MGLNADISQPSLTVSSGKMTYNRSPDWGWEHTPALGDIRPAVQNELVEERRALDDQGAFSCWLSSALGLRCLGGFQDVVGLRRPVSDDLFSY